jgi:Fe-S-cluster containining protein
MIDGKICQKHNCHQCCIETEMMLTKVDILRIFQNTLIPIDEFVKINEDGHRMLRNKGGDDEKSCVFLDSNGLCSIYDHRPEGCRFYPIIWDLNEGFPIADDLCPHNDEFSFLIPQVERELENFVLKLFGRL